MFGFKNQNTQNKILISVNTKFQEHENSEFFHFSRILHNGPRNQKYASFEGVENAVTPLFHRHLGTKKALTKSADFANSRVERKPFLVQNVKNQFFH